MKLRTKLVWAGILIVLIPILLSTGVMSYLIRQQNDEDVQQRSGQLLEMIRRELDSQARASVREMTYLSQDSSLISNLAFFNQALDPNMMSWYDYYKKEIGVALGRFARINEYNVLMIFDKMHNLLVYLTNIEGNRVIGIISQNDEGQIIFKTTNRERVIDGIEELDSSDWEVILPSQTTVLLRNPQPPLQPESLLDIVDGHLARKTSVTIREDPEDLSSEISGSIIGYQYTDETLVVKLEKQTQARINFFIDSQLYLGTFQEFNEIPESQLQKLQQVISTKETSYLYTEHVIKDQTYYQAYYPLLIGEDERVRSTLVLSLSKEPTYKKTREAVILQGGVSIICVLIIIPVTLFLAARIARPIRNISVISESIANGRIDQDINPGRAKDEIGILSRSFHAMVGYLQRMAEIAENISRGELTQEIAPKTEQDVLGVAYSQMIQYFEAITQVAARIQQGDLTQTVIPQSDRDVLATTFNAMIQRLQALVSNIRTQSRRLAEVSHNVAVASEETSEESSKQALSVDVISSALQEMAVNINSILHNLATQFTSIQHVRSSVRHIATSSEEVANKVDQLSSFTEQTAASIGKMDDSVQQIHHQVQNSVNVSKQVLTGATQGVEQVNHLMTEIHAIHEQMELTSSAILRLQQQSQHIGDILDVIQEVVEQTNLLALNASIIAAQAGEHGKAFSVVADEVKALATRTAESTKEISQFTKTIRTELTEAVNAMVISANYVESGLSSAQKTEQVLKIITKDAKESSQLITYTAQNIEEHSLASRQIQQASIEVVHMLEDITRLTQEQQAQSTIINNETEQLTSISQEIQQATKEQASAAQQSVETMADMAAIGQQNTKRAEHLAKLATDLSAQAKTLLKLVEQFIVEKQ